MNGLMRHAWIVLVLANSANGWLWWNRVQGRMRSHPELEPGYRSLYRGFLFWTNLPWVVMGLGIISGQVNGMFEYLQPSAGNPMVLVWWGLFIALLALGTHWIFAGGGAETLERHPGVFMVPPLPAATLRWLWLGLAIWNVLIAAAIFLGFPDRLLGLNPASNKKTWLPVLFPVLFVAMWLLTTFLLALMGGWRTLSQHYTAKSPFVGQRFRFRSVQFGSFTSYSSVVTLGAAPGGLYLAVAPIFRLAHPPLFIPWSDITAREFKGWLTKQVELEFVKASSVTVRLSRRLAHLLFDASGNKVVIRIDG